MKTISVDDFAAILRNESFDDGRARVMKPGSDGAITVNLTALTGQERAMVRSALEEWSTIADLRFVETTGRAQITYGNDGSSAHTRTTYSGGTILSAEVEVGSSRVAPGDGIGSYAFRTYMHETAHALGLGHPQNYGKVKDFGQSAIRNDSWQMSVLSYFDQIENTAINASKAYNLTPMAADYAAIRAAYGGVAVREGNTTYGVGSTAGGTLDKAAGIGARAAFLIADSKGVDTVSFAGFTEAQRIDLRSGAISDVMGGIGNMQIAPDTVIEHAIGGRGNDALIGNGAANRLTGGGGNDVLTGAGGSDTYVIDGGDRVVEGARGGADTIIASVNTALPDQVENLVLTGGARSGTGNGSANVITGNGLANTLDGRGGADRLIGGTGNDTYLWSPGDTIVEQRGGGTDTVRASASHTLTDWVENLILTGSATVGTGSSGANAITGTALANRLDGGAGADTLIGGGGNDIYVSDGRDTIIERTGGGFDRVEGAGSLRLAAQVEGGRLTGTAAASLTGNDLGNRLEGNGAGNILTGLAGRDTLIGHGSADTMIGGADNDIYIVTAGDRVVEAAGGGVDTVFSTATLTLSSEVERGVLTGTGAASLNGNAGANALTGNAGANVLSGRGGNDVLSGGGGGDRFVFTDGVDRIVDFTNNLDEIALSRPALGLISLAAVWDAAREVAGDVIFTFGVDRLLVEDASIAALRNDLVLV